MNTIPGSVPGNDLSVLFRLTSLEEVGPPPGCDGVWQRYVIAQGDNTITGMRAGQRSDVSAALADAIARLNTRFAKQKAKASR